MNKNKTFAFDFNNSMKCDSPWIDHVWCTYLLWNTVWLSYSLFLGRLRRVQSKVTKTYWALLKSFFSRTNRLFLSKVFFEKDYIWNDPVDLHLYVITQTAETNGKIKALDEVNPLTNNIIIDNLSLLSLWEFFCSIGQKFDLYKKLMNTLKYKGPRSRAKSPWDNNADSSYFLIPDLFLRTEMTSNITSNNSCWN